MKHCDGKSFQLHKMQKLHVKKYMMAKQIACKNRSSWYINTNVLFAKSKEENNG